MIRHLILIASGLALSSAAHAGLVSIPSVGVSGTFLVETNGGGLSSQDVAASGSYSIASHGAPGEDATSAIHVSLGTSPSISVNQYFADQPFNGQISDGLTSEDLIYYFVIFGPTGSVIINYSALVGFEHSAILPSEFESVDQALFTVSHNGVGILQDNAFLEGFGHGLNGVNMSGASTGLSGDVGSVATLSGTALTGIAGTVSDVGTVTLSSNTLYQVDLSVFAEEGLTGNPYDGQNNGLGGGSLANRVFVDPSFTISDQTPQASDFRIAFSSGTGGSTVPEPATWSLLLAGFGLAGLTMRSSTIRSRATIASGKRHANER